jgi:hypothetical protein
MGPNRLLSLGRNDLRRIDLGPERPETMYIYVRGIDFALVSTF